MILLDCKEMWRHISAYLDDDLDLGLRKRVEAHLAHCRHCAALVDSTRNILVLLADERMFELPLGFTERFRQKFEKELAKAGGDNSISPGE